MMRGSPFMVTPPDHPSAPRRKRNSRFPDVLERRSVAWSARRPALALKRQVDRQPGVDSVPPDSLRSARPDDDAIAGIVQLEGEGRGDQLTRIEIEIGAAASRDSGPDRHRDPGPPRP